jgi:muramoyltetrapeptide carboxypeptidase
MRLHGVFDQIAGLIVGQFTDYCLPKNPRRSFTLEDYLNGVLKGYDFPVVTNLAYGHLKRRFTLPIGLRVRLSTDPVGVTLLGC